MTDNYSFSNSPPYITYHAPLSPTKPTGHKIQSKIVTPGAKKNPYQRKIQSYCQKPQQLQSHQSLTHVKLPDNMENLSRKEYKSTMIHFERQNREYVIRQQQRNKNLTNQQHHHASITGHHMTESEHIFLERQTQNMIEKRTRMQQQRAKARRQQLKFRWKYSRNHMDHPNPWNLQWAAHYKKMHPGKDSATPWLRTIEDEATDPPHFLVLHLSDSFKT